MLTPHEAVGNELAERHGPPSDLEAERAVLGCCLLDSGPIKAARGILKPEDFVDRDPGRDPADNRSPHRIIFKAILALDDAGEPADLVNVTRVLRDSGALKQIAGGAAYLSSLMDGVARSVNVESYARRVRRCAVRRAVFALADGVRGAASNGVTDRDLVELAEGLLETARKGAPRTEAVPLASIEATPAEFTVRDFLPRSGVAMVYAKAGSRKTYLLLLMVSELLLRPRRPTDLFGHPDLKILKPIRKVLWFSVEETGGRLRARLDWTLAGMGAELTAADLEDRLLFRWAIDSPAVTLDQLDGEIPDDVDLVVCDSVTAMLPATFEGKEIDSWEAANDAVRKIANRLRRLAADREILVVLVHHEGKDSARGARGASEWLNSVDLMLRLDKRKGADKAGQIGFVVEKQRDARELLPFVLQTEHGPGTFTANYLSDSGDSEEPADRKSTPTMRAVLELVTSRAAAAGNPPDFTIAHRDIVAGVDANRDTVNTAVDRLIAAGELRDTGRKVANSRIYSFGANPKGSGALFPGTDGSDGRVTRQSGEANRA